MKETYEMCRIIKQLMTSNSMDTRIYYATSDDLFFDWLTSLVTFFDKTLYSPRVKSCEVNKYYIHCALHRARWVLYTYWLGMRVIALLLYSRYQLPVLSESTPRTKLIQRGQKKLYYPNIKCFIILNNCAIQNSKL